MKTYVCEQCQINEAFEDGLCVECTHNRSSGCWPGALALLLVAVLMIALCSCAIGPTVYSDGERQVAHLGSSILTQAKGDTASITLADGTVLTRSTEERDEVSGVVKRAMWGAVPGIVSPVAAAAKAFAR